MKKKSGRWAKRKGIHHGTGRGNKKRCTVTDDASNTTSDYDSSNDTVNEGPSDKQYVYFDKDYNAIFNLSDLFHVISDNFSTRSSMSAGMSALLNEFATFCKNKIEDLMKK